MVRARWAGIAGLGEGLLGQPLVLGLDVDGGQDAVGAHAAQQPEAGDAGAGADLDDGAGLEHGGQEAQGGAAAGADRDHADLVGARAGGGEHVVLGDVLLGVGPARGLDGPGRGLMVASWVGTGRLAPGVDERLDPIARKPSGDAGNTAGRRSLCRPGISGPGVALTAFSQP